MTIRGVRCDICGKTGDLNRCPYWRILRDFAYCRYACPDCAGCSQASGLPSHLKDAVLSSMVRKREEGGGR